MTLLLSFCSCLLLLFCVALFQAFAKAFKSTPDDLDMHIVYDVSHNIAKVEEHISTQEIIIHLQSAQTTLTQYSTSRLR